jgi:hypothetical protein
VSGGGGAPMREARHDNPQSLVFTLNHHYVIAKRTDGKLAFNVWSLENELLDSFELSGF